MEQMKAKLAAIEKMKVPLLILLFGVLLMLLPGGGTKRSDAAVTDSERLALVLSGTQGLGETRVLISDNGVVVVCRGADKASVRLDIIRAVRSYTGFGSDKITILKLAD